MPITRPSGAARKAGLRLGPRGSIQPRIFVRNTGAVIANIFAKDRAVKAAIRKTVKVHAELLRDLTRFLAPRDTGFMGDNVRITYGDQKLAFEVGWEPADFAKAGLPYYPPFQEFGTSRHAAQPSLGPAYNDVAPQFQQALRADIRLALSRQLARGG